MISRRKFIKNTSVFSGMIALQPNLFGTMNKSRDKAFPEGSKPLVLSTWKHGLAANEAAWKILDRGGKALDAVEQGVRVTEDDLSNLSVGLGGLPDRDGRVTLDANIMDEKGRCGAVACIEKIKHPISVARLVMEKTPHVLLVGLGAQQFALQNGFPLESGKLSPVAEKEYKEWVKKSDYKPVINIENHDTIGMIAIDKQGNLSGSCTTSGLAWKIHGRVGDSPITGAGLFVDNEVGAACATGVGEAVLRICGSHLVVELMRQGKHPMEACKLAIERLVSKNPNHKDIQVGFLAINRSGEYGGYALQKGFNFAVADQSGNKLLDASFFE